jgi:opacity protein-like surface antigen
MLKIQGYFMRRLALLILSSILITATIYCQADQTASTEEVKPVDHEAYLYGGAAFPYLTTSFRENWKPSHTVGFGYGVSFEPGDLGYIAIYGTAEFNKFRGPDDFTARMYDVMINLKGSFSPSKKSIAPYFRIGVGYMYHTIDSISTNNGGTDVSAFGWTFGVGVEVPIVQSITVFVEGSSVLAVLNPTRQAFPIIGGVRYRF